MHAQIGLGVDPTGGIIVILLGVVLAIAGLVSCVIGAVLLVRSWKSRSKALLILFLGLVLMSPALWFAWEMFAPDFPRDKSWDFSTSLSVAQLHEAKDAEAYYYQGNLRSTVKLSSNRQWSGNAYLVVFRARAGRITDVHWQTRAADAPQAYQNARRILKELALPDRDLDSWYAKVRRGEPASFSVVAGSDTDVSIEVRMRGSVAEENWVVHVNVSWK